MESHRDVSSEAELAGEQTRDQTRKRALRGACGGALLLLCGLYACATATPEESAPPSTQPLPPPGLLLPEPAGEAATATADASAPEAVTVVWQPPAEAALLGLDGAAQQLNLGDPARALAVLEVEEAPPEGEAQWFRAQAIRGRAHRLVNQPKFAVAALESISGLKALRRHLPPELVAYELALARLDWAKSGDLERDKADEQCKKAASELAKSLKLRPNRISALMRLAQTRAMLSVQGEPGQKSEYWAGVKAVRSVDRFLAAYPKAPAVPELELARAKALIKAKKTKDAAAALRKLALERAGSPHAAQAWQVLEELAAEHSKIKVRPFSTEEQIDRAGRARRLRWVDTSRELLDAVIGDPEVSESTKRRARKERAWTAYKQRDYATCAADFQELYERSGSYELRDNLARCLDRAHMYDEAITLWSTVAKKKKKGYAASKALWNATQQAVRGGRYQEAADLLGRFEKISRAHGRQRRWLHAWLPYRLGDGASAVDAFEDLERYSDWRYMARFFRGKILLSSDDPTLKERGEGVLRELVDEAGAELHRRSARRGFPLYYGLLARQRLLDADYEVIELPKLKPMRDDSKPLGYAKTRVLLAQVAEDEGEAFSSLRRADQLHAVGWMSEAKRELRVAIDEYLNGRARLNGGRAPKWRTEALVAGLGWKAEWSYPSASPGRDGRKAIRDRERSGILREELRQLSWALDEPYRFVKLTPASERPYKERWGLRAFRAQVEREAGKHGIDPARLWALAYSESRFRPYVVSPVGARGAIQIMPWTGRQLVERLGGDPAAFDPDTLFEVETNITLSALYTAELLKKFKGQAPLAYASYNGGPNSVARWLEAKAEQGRALPLEDYIEEIVFDETRKYVRRVMEVHASYHWIYHQRWPVWPKTLDPEVGDNIDF